MKNCSMEGCPKAGTVRGYCRNHYFMLLWNGTLTRKYKKSHSGKCGIYGCTRPFFAVGICRLHYAAAKKGKKLDRIDLLLPDS